MEKVGFSLIKVIKLVPLILTAFLFYFTYLFKFHFPDFGNFFTPLNLSSLNWSIFFNNRQFDAIINTTPESAFFVLIIYNIPFYTLSHFFGLDFAGRIFVFLSLFSYLVSWYYFAGEFTDSYTVKLISSVFAAFNPFMIGILSAGDPNILIFESCLFISLALLVDASRSPFKLLSSKRILSVVLLAMTIGYYQCFVLGTALYTILMLYLQPETSKSQRKDLIITISTAVFSLLLLIVLIIPDIYPLFLGGYTSEFIANPGLGSFISNSEPSFNLLYLINFPYNLSSASVLVYGVSILRIWLTIDLIVLTSLLLLPLLLKKYKLSIISVLIIFFSLLGSNADSFLYPLSSYLYLHVPGYGSLNGSYFWDWFLIVPLYSFLLVNILSEFSVLNNTLRNLPRRWNSSVMRRFQPYLKPLFLAFVLVLLFVPTSSQGYYNSNGINETWGNTIPPSYAEIQNELKVVVNGSEGGVAYFNPDQNLFFNNTSKWFVNPLITFPSYRTAELTYYATGNLPSNTFFYWVYSLFYDNQTRYIGQLFSLAGIEFLVVLNGTNSYSYDLGFMPFSEGKSANSLMRYQENIVQLYVGNGFVIYRNDYYYGVVQSYRNLTLVSGGLNELASLPYFGFNLSASAIVMSTDLCNSEYSNIMSHVGTVVFPDKNSLYSILLPELGRPLYAASYVTSDSIFNSWASTQNLPPNWYYQSTSLTPVAMTRGKANLSIPLGHLSHGNYNLWVQVKHSQIAGYTGGLLVVSINNVSYEVNASKSISGITNSMLWERLPFTVETNSSRIIVRFESMDGLNSIGQLYVLDSGVVKSAFSAFNETMSTNKVVLDEDTPANIVSVLTNGNSTYTIGSSGSSKEPMGSYFYMNSNHNSTASLNLSFPSGKGRLYLGLLNSNGGLLKLSGKDYNETIGISQNAFLNSTIADMSFVEVNVSSPSNQFTLTLLSGFIFVGEIMFLRDFTPIKQEISVPTIVFNNTYVPGNWTITNFTNRFAFANDSININLTLSYKGVVNKALPIISINYKTRFLYNETLSVEQKLTDNYYTEINTVLLGDSPYQAEITPPLYGVFSRSRDLYIDVFEENPPQTASNITHTIFIDVTFNFLKYSGKLDFVIPDNLIDRGHLNYDSFGYSVYNMSYITVIRLPYYSQMTIVDEKLNMISTLFSVNQILLSSHSNFARFQVTYVNAVMIISGADIVVIALLLTMSYLHSKKHKSKKK